MHEYLTLVLFPYIQLYRPVYAPSKHDMFNTAYRSYIAVSSTLATCTQYAHCDRSFCVYNQLYYTRNCLFYLSV